MARHLFAASLVFLASAAQAEPMTLGTDAIREMVTGTIVDIDTPIGTKLPFTYTHDGKLAGEAPGLAWYLGSASDRGQWWVERNRLCHKWSIWFHGKPQCLRIRQDGQRFHWRNDDGDAGTATIRERLAPPVTVAAKPEPKPAAKPSAPAKDPSSQALKPEEPRRFATAALAAPANAASAPQATAPKAPAKPAAAEAAAAPPKPITPAAGAASAPSASKPSVKVLAGAAAKSPQKPAPMAVAKAVPTAKAAKDQRAATAAAPAQAATGTFRVAGVEAFDVLNVRSGPSADFSPVGAIPPEARGVSIIGPCRQDWCPVRHRETRGWVNSFYLVEDRPTQGAAAPSSRIVRE